MRSSIGKSHDRARIMADIVAGIVHDVTGVPVEYLRSNACTHQVTRARCIFVGLCEGVVSPASILAEYLSKNNSMISYYKRAYSEHYVAYKDFRELSDKADRVLTDLLTNVNGTFRNVFQKEEQ